MTTVIVAIVGPGDGATRRDRDNAYELGHAIARAGWILLTGGRNQGVMDAASRGAKEAGGLTVGVLPSPDKDQISRFVDIPIVTGLGEARNNVNVLSSEVVFACGMGPGTASEVALAIKARREVVLLEVGDPAERFFVGLDPDRVHAATDVDDAIATARRILQQRSRPPIDP